MKKIYTILLLFLSIISFGQESNNLQRIFRINILNLGIEYEFPVLKKSVISINPGIGWNVSYCDSRSPFNDSGLTHYISPFMDIAYKNIYNRRAREKKSKIMKGNSGNYWGVRFLTKFKEFDKGGADRETNIDFSLSPTWGMQRTYGKFHLQFELEPSLFFDTKGNCSFFPMIQLNMGFNI